MLCTWVYWEHEDYFKHGKATGCWNTFVGWQTVEEYALPGSLHSILYSWVQLVELGARAVMYSTSHFDWFSYISKLVLRQQSKKDLVWSIVVIESIILTIFQFLTAYCDCHVGFPCRDDCTHRSGQGTLVPLTENDCMCINKSGLALFLEG